MEAKLLFAPLIRVSTERQERQGESLRTQKGQLTQAVESIGGEVYRWYEGQESASPDYERRILADLMADAQARKFDAVMVADLSRWSRDNGKSKQYIKILQRSGIRFFEGAREINLFDPTQAFVLGMGVEVAEFFAGQQAYKSIINRIARAKQGHPSCGKKPYGRIWDKTTKTWTVDKKAQAKVREIAKLYLTEDVSWRALGERFGMNPSNLCKILTLRSGPDWEQEFISKRCGIKETISIKVPPLLPEEIIKAVQMKSRDRASWDRKSRKNDYLFSKIIFDKETGFALTGLTNSKGMRYYRPHHPDFGKDRYQVNAEVLEQAILREFFEVLSTKESLRQAVFEGNPVGKIAAQLQAEQNQKREELTRVEAQLESYVTAIGNADDVAAFMTRIKPRIVEYEDRVKALKDVVAGLEFQLSALPSDQEIEDVRDKWAGLLEAVRESFLSSGAALETLPFGPKRKLIKMIFGGADEAGKRYGIYIIRLPGKPRRYRFEAYGRIGGISGFLTSRTGTHVADADLVDNPELSERISQLILEANPCLLGQCHAHHRQRLHQ